MIRKIKRRVLDTDKYTQTLAKAQNHRIYAEYWYMDVVTGGNWECIVYGDYEVVMPIPLQYKFGIKWVAQPMYCQQLGVFYNQDMDEELFRIFEKQLHQYRVRSYHFNEDNTTAFQPKGTLKVNHLLDLRPDFNTLSSAFKRDRKKDLRRHQGTGLQLVQSAEIDLFFSLFKQDYQQIAGLMDEELTRYYLKMIQNQGRLVGFELQDASNKPLAVSILIDAHERLILMFSARNKATEPKGGFAWMISEVIRWYSGKEKKLDFEGSSIEGIAAFNESFGAEKQFYTVYRNFPF
ncbi:MAG: hypothetical protein J5I52_01520 [Saprospiraceae bacterium]|nr:MAG: putative methicillin resistance protein [Bacteroidetes bacterium OLB9]MCO6462805.1 hypothetical protein [Saprospiraceae bacterium]